MLLCEAKHADAGVFPTWPTGTRIGTTVYYGVPETG